jgi:hypothetical protein
VYFIPPTNDISLCPANSYVLAHDNELDTVCFLGVKCGILLLGQTKVEYVSSIVPNEVHDDIREIKSDKINPWLYFTMITVLNEELSITVNLMVL